MFDGFVRAQSKDVCQFNDIINDFDKYKVTYNYNNYALFSVPYYQDV